MKTTKLLSAFVLLILSLTSYGQHCPQDSTTISPHASAITPGLSPSDVSAPCLLVGVPVSDTLYFSNYDTLASTPNLIIFNSWKFDSIELPAGLCWTANHTTNTFVNGENATILIKGTPTAPAGQYKLRIIADILAHSGNTPLNLPNQDVESLLHLRYSLRISCPGSCPAFNSVDTMDTFIPNTSCAGTSPIATIGTAGSLACAGDTITIIAGSGTGYTYLWSTGDSTQMIYAQASGTYSVTVSNGSGIINSASIFVPGVSDSISASFALIQDTIAHQWLAVNNCTALLPLSYTWSWGDGTASSTGAYPSHIYSTPGYYDICVSVSDSFGCSAIYCDSSTYVFKTDGQMIGVRVVNSAHQQPSGINELTDGISVKAYPNPASQTLTIESPVILGNAIICDALGRAVGEADLTTLKATIDLSSISDGVYFLVFKNAAAHTVRFVIAK